MPRYFFDVHETGKVDKDDTGTEMLDRNAVRVAAMRLLPDIVREEISKDGDHRAFAVLVTDADEHPIYSATLSYTGLWLRR